MGAPPLSQGVLAHALYEENFNGCPITLQILDVQNIKSKDGTQPQRSKMTVSDGVYKCTALLASQLKVLVDDGRISKFHLVRVTELVGNKKLGATAGNKKLLIVLNVDNANPTFPYNQMIGNPQPVPDMNETNGAPGVGMGGPPPAAAGGYGGPPPAVNGGPGLGMYGGGPGGPPAGPGQHAGPGQFGGPPPMQQQGGGPGPGMYGGPAPQQQQFGGGPGGPGGGPGMYGGGPGGGGPAYGMGGGPIAHSQQPLAIVPIKGLNPYQSRWTIKARVTQKSDVRTWSNARSEGKLMSFDLVDKDGGEIKATAWNDQVDMFQDMIQVGRVLMISKASLKPRNARFNNTPHEFEIYLERNSSIAPCEDDADTAAIPHIMFNFRKLAELETTEAGTIVDVIGVLDTVEPWAVINKKDGTETRKRSLTIRDDSGRSVEVTFWDKFATGGDGPNPSPGDQLEQALQAGARPVVALKSVRVGDFNGKNLGSISSSTVAIDPDRPEAQQLRSWYAQGGNSMCIAPLSERGGAGGGRQDRRIAFAQIDSEGLGMNGQADWVQVAGYINFIRNESMTYPSCPKLFNGRVCQKKVVQDDNGQWRCDRCQESVPDPIYRYLLSLSAQDHTGSKWLSAFGDSGETVMGRPAGDISNLDMIDPEVLREMLHERMFLPYTFKLKVFQDTYNDESRMKITISKLAPLDPVMEGRVLVDLIHKMDAGQPIFTPPGGPAAAAGDFGGAPQFGGGAAPSPYGGGVGGGAQGGWNQQQQQQQLGPGGGWNAPAAAAGGGGGWNGGGGGMPQQQGGYGGPQGVGGGFGAPPQNAGGYGGGGFNQQQQGGFGAPGQQQQYNQQPFNAGYL